ncbi:MAG: hypothetical protein EPN22_13490 [Nitrospirae bacterium]|nr:MAG: hypothetical protein EPN22_13490 [Nitrospirota bacterium]
MKDRPSTMDIYKKIVKLNVPRLLSIYNMDSYSATYGYGDRRYWGWKLTDFVNGTFQGGVHSLAIALKLKIIENEHFALDVIDKAIRAVQTMQSKKGSMVEAYHGEHSFCVTALVAFDVLSSVKHLGHRISFSKKNEYLKIVEPLICFITRVSEEHGIISNHLATAVAAISIWNKLTNNNNIRDRELLKIIYENQSEEGWYREYEGADPGYQTLCTYYLSSAYEETGDEELKASLIRSAAFLKYFIHPDGTVGGLYGSRNTEVYYPGGIVGLADLSDDFSLLATELQKGVVQGHHIFPENVDIENFVPLLNSYSVAALYCEKGYNISKLTPPYAESCEKDFGDAGIYIKSTKRYYAITNYKKGGTIKVFDKMTGKIDIEDGGLFGELENGTKFSTQQIDSSIDFADKEIKTNLYMMNEAYPTPLQFILLRLLSITLFRSLYLGNMFKKLIVKMLMTGKRKIDGDVLRKFSFFEDRILVKEIIKRPKNCRTIGHSGKCKSIHMASSGYFNRQMEQMPEKSDIVVISEAPYITS